MSAGLLPCPMPWCQSTLVGTGRLPCGVATVSCGTCGVSVPGPDADPTKAIAVWNNRPTAPAAAPTDISARLRNIANTTAHSALILSAADECERYYSGMMAWKQTAEKKDADWNAERMGRVNDRIAARATAPSVIEAAIELTDASQDVLAERRRQVEGEGWTAERDDEYVDYSLAQAAAAYAIAATVDGPDRDVMDDFGNKGIPAKVRNIWPSSWSGGWFKPTSRRADLVKAGALVLAEIERLDRAAPSDADPTK